MMIMSDAVNPKLDMENLKALWSYATTHRERAQIESWMWDLVPRGERQAGGCRTWLHRTLQVAYRTSEARTSIWMAEPDSQILWDRIDGPERMLVRSGLQILQRARIRSIAETCSLKEAIVRELAEYDTWQKHETAEGTFRKRPARPKGFAIGTRPKRDRRDPANVAKRVQSSRELWGAVRAAVKRVVDAELQSIGDMRMRESLRSQIEVEISSMISLLNGRIRNAKQNASLNNAPVTRGSADRKKLRAACQLLSVDPPAIGEHASHAMYMAAKKNFRRLAREYHPDVTGDASHDRYDAVVEAMRTIEESYQAKDSATTNEESDNHGDEHE